MVFPPPSNSVAWTQWCRRFQRWEFWLPRCYERSITNSLFSYHPCISTQLTYLELNTVLINTNWLLGATGYHQWNTLWSMKAAHSLNAGLTLILGAHPQIDRFTGMVMNLTDLKRCIEVRPYLIHLSIYMSVLLKFELDTSTPLEGSERGVSCCTFRLLIHNIINK